MRSHEISDLLASLHVLENTPAIWFDVARGSVSADDAARMLRDVEDDALIERSKDLFAPPSPERTQAIQHLILDATRSKRRRSRAALMAFFAAAAALVLTILLYPSARTGYPPLGTEYGLELSSPWELERAPASKPEVARPLYRIDQRVTFTLRPRDAVEEGELAIAIFAYAEDGDARRVPTPSVIDVDHGVVRFSTEPRALGLSEGIWRIAVAVGRPQQLPERDELLEDTSEDPQYHAVVEATIEVVDER